MSAEEVAARGLAAMRQGAWRISQLRPSAAPIANIQAQAVLPRKDWPRPLPNAALDVLDEAEKLLGGEWPVFAIRRTLIGAEPDWFLDPLTGIRAPHDKYCFSISHRDESVVGNVKYVWEPSRHQATTLLATAFWISGDRRFAERAAAHLNSWWRQNPFLMGIHWTSGIEVGLRLLSWTWIRALLGDWDGGAGLFERNPAFIEQLYWHQKYLASFRSVGSSANNHVIAELAGLATAAAAFPWFAESREWANEARAALETEARRQTNGDGTNREQASDYHLFVLDILVAAGLGADLASAPLPDSYWQVIANMSDALAAMIDCRGNSARFGDADDGRCLVVDTRAHAGPTAMLDALSEIVGAQSWWPRPGIEPGVLHEIAACVGSHHAQSHDRREQAPMLLQDSGCALLRAGSGDDEIWLRCDHGPLGFLSIAAHGHADALSIELRLGGVEVLIDPGTYCYHGEPAWRRYFKGTRAHNTLAIRGEDQAIYGGPFLWLSSPHTVLDAFHRDERTDQFSWEAHHDGYERFGVTHHRRVLLSTRTHMIEVEDWIDAATAEEVTLSYHLGPRTQVSLVGRVARLSWKDDSGKDCTAQLKLDDRLDWSLHRGQADPPLGWYSARFGEREPTSVLVGCGTIEPHLRVRTEVAWSAYQPAVPGNVLVEAGLSQ